MHRLREFPRAVPRRGESKPVTLTPDTWTARPNDTAHVQFHTPAQRGPSRQTHASVSNTRLSAAGGWDVVGGPAAPTAVGVTPVRAGHQDAHTALYTVLRLQHVFGISEQSVVTVCVARTERSAFQGSENRSTTCPLQLQSPKEANPNKKECVQSLVQQGELTATHTHTRPQLHNGKDQGG